MPRDAAVNREVSEWLAKAAVDLRAAGVDLDADPPIVEDAMFHCQQAVEKSLKAFLSFHGLPFRKTHDLNELSAPAVGVDPELESWCDRVIELTPFAWAFRYPGDVGSPSAEEGRDALDTAAAFVRTISERIEVESAR